MSEQRAFPLEENNSHPGLSSRRRVVAEMRRAASCSIHYLLAAASSSIVFIKSRASVQCRQAHFTVDSGVEELTTRSDEFEYVLAPHVYRSFVSRGEDVPFQGAKADDTSPFQTHPSWRKDVVGDESCPDRRAAEMVSRGSVEAEDSTGFFKSPMSTDAWSLIARE